MDVVACERGKRGAGVECSPMGSVRSREDALALVAGYGQPGQRLDALDQGDVHGQPGQREDARGRARPGGRAQSPGQREDALAQGAVHAGTAKRPLTGEAVSGR